MQLWKEKLKIAEYLSTMHSVAQNRCVGEDFWMRYADVVMLLSIFCIEQKFSNQQLYNWFLPFDNPKLVMTSRRWRFVLYSKVMDLFCRLVEEMRTCRKVLSRAMFVSPDELECLHSRIHSWVGMIYVAENAVNESVRCRMSFFVSSEIKKKQNWNILLKPIRWRLKQTFLKFNGFPVFLLDVQLLYA